MTENLLRYVPLVAINVIQVQHDRQLIQQMLYRKLSIAFQRRDTAQEVMNGLRVYPILSVCHRFACGSSTFYLAALLATAIGCYC